MNSKPERPKGLTKHQTTFYDKYISKGYEKDSALYLASMAGMPIKGGFVSDPEKYIATHPAAHLAWMDFHSPSVMEEFRNNYIINM